MGSNIVTIYGMSVDLVKLEGAIHAEAGTYADDVSVIVLTAPDDKRLAVEIGFCSEIKPDGWGIRVAGETGVVSPRWPMLFGLAPGNNPEGNPALIVQVPEGTTAAFNGEKML